jgi:heat shock protein HslJ
MKISLFLAFSSLIGMAFCTSENDQSIETWWVDGTSVTCEGVVPMNCIQIQKNQQIDPDAWKLFYDKIEGFEAETGNIYQIRVKITSKTSPIPQDVSSANYELVEIISSTSNKLFLANSNWRVLSVGGVKDPLNPFTNESLIFEFEMNKKSYSGDLGCNKIAGKITERKGEKILFDLGASTKMACVDMSLENAISNGLKETKSYKIENNQMRFFNQEGQILIEFETVN